VYLCRALFQWTPPSVKLDLSSRLFVIRAGIGVAVAALAMLAVLLLTGWKV